MPTYDYRCTACGHTCEVVQKMSDAPLDVCPHCQEGPFKRIITSVGVIFKGSGFHINDYKGAPAAAEASSAPAPGADAPAADPAPSPSGDSPSGDGGSSGKAVA